MRRAAGCTTHAARRSWGARRAGLGAGPVPGGTRGSFVRRALQLMVHHGMVVSRTLRGVGGGGEREGEASGCSSSRLPCVACAAVPCRQLQLLPGWRAGAHVWCAAGRAQHPWRWRSGQHRTLGSGEPPGGGVGASWLLSGPPAEGLSPPKHVLHALHCTACWGPYVSPPPPRPVGAPAFACGLPCVGLCARSGQEAAVLEPLTLVIFPMLESVVPGTRHGPPFKCNSLWGLVGSFAPPPRLPRRTCCVRVSII